MLHIFAPVQYSSQLTFNETVTREIKLDSSWEQYIRNIGSDVVNIGTVV